LARRISRWGLGCRRAIGSKQARCRAVSGTLGETAGDGARAVGIRNSFRENWALFSSYDTMPPSIRILLPSTTSRSPRQIGRKGLSNHRWMVGGKLCLLLNQYGLVAAWTYTTPNVADNTLQWLIRQFEERMIVLSDTAFHAAEGDPSNLKLCPRGEWQDRMLVETVLSMLTLISHFKKAMHRV
jgi:hypothetical protein